DAADPGGEDDAVDFNLFQSAYNDYEKALTDLQTYGDANKKDLNDQKKAPNWPLADSHYSQFLSAASSYQKESKDFFRCLRDAPAKAKTPNGKVDMDKLGTCPDGRALQTQGEVVQKYNEFIRTSNQNQFP